MTWIAFVLLDGVGSHAVLLRWAGDVWEENVQIFVLLGLGN